MLRMGLQVHNEPVSAAGVAALGALAPRLQRLSLRTCSKVNDACARSIGRLRNLRVR